MSGELGRPCQMARKGQEGLPGVRRPSWRAGSGWEGWEGLGGPPGGPGVFGRDGRGWEATRKFKSGREGWEGLGGPPGGLGGPPGGSVGVSRPSWRARRSRESLPVSREGMGRPEGVRSLSRPSGRGYRPLPVGRPPGGPGGVRRPQRVVIPGNLYFG